MDLPCQVMRKLLQTTDRIVQEIDSVEYGLTDIQVGRWGEEAAEVWPHSVEYWLTDMQAYVCAY